LQPLTEQTGLGLEETAYALNNMGTLAFATGEMGLASSLFSRAISLRQVIVSKFLRNEKNLINLSNSISWLARTQESDGQITSALASYRLQLNILEDAKSFNPDDVSSRVTITHSRHWIGLLELQLGNTNKSSENLKFVVNELESLIRLDASQAQWARQLAVARSDLAWTLFSQVETKQALEVIDAALTQLIEVMRVNPSFKDRRVYAIALFRKASILRSVDDLKNSASLFAKAHLNIKALHLENPNDQKVTFAWINSLLALPVKTENLSNALEANEVLKPLVEKQVNAEALEALVRVNVLLGNQNVAQVFEEKLDKMQYNHPLYREFLASQRKGLSP